MATSEGIRSNDSLHILVVEDERKLADAISEGLAGSGYQRTGMVQRVDQVAQRPSLNGTSVVKICAACKVPRRTLNRAFRDALGMGPVTYLRRVRLNGARRTLLGERERPITVTDVALEQGFWHLGRFAEQYNKMFDESPHETLRRSD